MGSWIKLAPSILSADFGRLGEQVAEATKAGADYIHVDAMDGKFVPNLTMGPLVVEGIRPWTHLPLDVHLMVQDPEPLLPAFVKAGANLLTVHVEACTHLHRTLDRIKELGVKAGVALNPSTPIGVLEETLPYLDLVLVMTVNPGFPAQSFIREMTGKITRIRQLLDDRGLKVELEVDGGINSATAPEAVKAGATILVAGSAVFLPKEGISASIRRIRKSAENLAL